MEQKRISEKIYLDLPPMLKSLTDNYEDVEKDIVLLSTIGAVSSCLPNVMGTYDKNTVYPHLFIIIIAPPASGKGVMNHPRKLIEPIHNYEYKKSLAKREEWLKQQKNKKNNSPESSAPNIVLKIMPANISSIMLYKYLDSGKHGVLIMESEADTLTNMLKNEWSNFSDVMRKSFHHEPISLDRKNDSIHLEVAEPKLSIVLSGTPSQLMPLLKSTEDGLFSRMIIYHTNKITSFKDVFSSSLFGGKKQFEIESIKFSKLYKELESRNSPLIVCLSKSQEENFLKYFSFMQNKLTSQNDIDLIPNLRRFGLILFRLCMILTITRNIDTIAKVDKIECSDKDFKIALKIVNILFHNLKNFPVEELCQINSQKDRVLFNNLNDVFTRNELIELGRKSGYSIKSVDNRIKKWKELKLIDKNDNSSFKKIIKTKD